MSLNKSQLLFWYNSLVYRSILDEMRSYVSEVSHFFDSDRSTLLHSDSSELDDPNLEAEFAIASERYESQFPRLLGNSFVVALASFLEQELLRYCDTLSKVGQKSLRANDIRGSYVDQFKTYSTKVAGLALDFESNLWSDNRGFVEVRNAIVHDGGSVNDDKRGAAIKSLNKRYPTLNIVGDKVYPTMPFCNQMVQCVHDFLEHTKKIAYDAYK